MLAIIPARGGSKGLPGKNTKLLNGKPLIAYTIEAALSSDEVSKVIVSTDSQEIADVAVNYGAECPFLRPDELASDSANAIDTYKYTLERLEKIQGVSIDSFIVLQPTSPLRTSGDIDEAISLFKEKKADSVVSYCREHHPIKWHKYLTDEGKFRDIFINELKNRQLEIPSYYPNGAIYILKKSILVSNTYYSDKSYAYVMDRKNSIDIDDIDDFDYAEFLIKKLSRL